MKKNIPEIKEVKQEIEDCLDLLQEAKSSICKRDDDELDAIFDGREDILSSFNQAYGSGRLYLNSAKNKLSKAINEMKLD